MMTLYLEAKKPNDKATHVKVCVRHTDKKVMLSADPVTIERGFIRQAFLLTSKRRSRFPLAEMPRLAPKQFRLRCDGVRAVIDERKTDDLVWRMIREAASEGNIEIPEDATLRITEG